MNKLLLYLLFMQKATEMALKYLATNHDKKEDIGERPCSLTVDVLIKVSFDIIVFDSGLQTIKLRERNCLFSFK